jgi:hypothetical protein
MAAKHHVLCIHGIGKHDLEWVDAKDDGEKTFEETLSECWEKYPGLKKHAFDDVFELHSICYDDEIRKLLKNWKDQADAIKQTLSISPLLSAEAARFTDLFDGATTEAGADPSKDEDWRQTHVADLLLIMGSPTIQDALVTHIGDQVLKLIRKWAKDEGKLPLVSIVAHSAGTAMAHKTIQALFNEKVDGTTLGPHFQFKLVCMVANTSFTLSRDRDNHYTGWVRPSLVAGQGCCTRWINVNHKLDPVGRFKKFDFRKNPAWLDPAVEGRRWHRDILLSRISSKNIHSINHYFRDPALHIPFFELAVGAKFTEADLSKATDEFIEKTPEGKFKTLKGFLDRLDPSEATSFKDWVTSLSGFRKLIRQFA